MNWSVSFLIHGSNTCAEVLAFKLKITINLSKLCKISELYSFSKYYDRNVLQG